jgi:hypothetical protein
MSKPIRRIPTQQHRPPAAPPDPVLNGEIMGAERDGLATVARLQAGAFAASVAMHNACMLSRAANAAFKVSPMGEEIYQSILMAYGSLAVFEIQSLGLHGKGQR